VNYLSDIIAWIMRQMSSEGDVPATLNKVQLEMLFQVYTFLIRLNDLINDQGIVPGTDIVFRLIRKMMRNMHLPFSGEPLAGLQILGLLETRTLDFDNVILLSANEGVLPRHTDKPSFIPFSLRSGFGLPGPDHEDAIYAYYFYRLIQRAKNVTLIYDCSTGGLRTGERSRFLHQIFYEMSLSVSEINMTASIARIPVKPIAIPKAGRVAEKLFLYKSDNGKFLSPSAINEFLNCGLKFCLHHLLDLPQPVEVTEDIDARMLGNILHRAMRILYARFISTMVTKTQLEPLLKDGQHIDSALDKAFAEEFYGEDEKDGDRKIEGYNLIIRQVIQTYIRQLVRADLESGPFGIVSLEEKHLISMPISVNGKRWDLNIGGVIDRIDSRQGDIVIIDYKTGTVKNNFSTIESLFHAEKQLRNEAVFQVLLYAHIYSRLKPGQTVIPGLYFIRGSHSDDFSYLIKHGAKREVVASYASVKQEFEDWLTQSLTEMFDERIPFTQTSNPRLCTFCAYKAICRR